MISDKLIKQCEDNLKKQFEYFEEIALYNQEKVLSAFQKNRLALRHFTGTTGYGYGDEGRDVLNAVFADIFGAEKAICSPNIVSGTHALSLCLFGVLMPNDKALCITGTPYDTLNDVIYGTGNGSLKDYGIEFTCIDLINGEINKDKIKQFFESNGCPKMIYMQRSRGYAWRDALSINDIKNAVDFVKSLGFNGCIMLDNCYGEFLDKLEATNVGVNLMAGSMIKNPGGGIAPTGGYIVGRKDVIEQVSSRFMAPSIGLEVGSYAGSYTPFFQGCFASPSVTLNALKGSILFGRVAEKLGFSSFPKFGEMPHDIVRTFEMGNAENLIDFCRMIQKNSPVDSTVVPFPWDMPGYNNQIIMASGSFIQGSSIELSADGPIRPPYLAYLQGGLNYEHVKIVAIDFAQKYLG